MAIGAEQFHELVAATARKVEGELFDNVVVNHPTLEFLKDEAKSWAGDPVHLLVRGGANDSTVLTDESGSFSQAKDDDVVGRAVYDWSNFVVSKTRLPARTLELNQGEGQLVDMAKTHLEAAEEGHAAEISEMLFEDAGSMQSGAFLPLDALIGDADSDAAAGIEVGGIDTNDANTSRDYWQSVRWTAAEGDWGIKEALRKTANNIYVASRKKANRLIVGQDVFEEYEAALDPNVRYQAMDVGETRFEELKFGGLTVRLDPDAPKDRVYFLYPKGMRFVHAPGAFMSVRDPQVVPGTLDYVTPIASLLCLAVGERRAQGLMIRDYA